MASTNRCARSISTTRSLRFAPLSLTERMMLPSASGPSGSIETSRNERIVSGHRATASNTRHSSSGDAEVVSVCVTVSGSIGETCALTAPAAE
jgi:hypothetical protein